MFVAMPRGLAGAAAIFTLVLGLAACDSGSGTGSGSGTAGSAAHPEEVAQLSPEQVVLASYDGLEAESYTMEMTMTVNGLTFIEATSTVDGEASQASQDLHMSAILAAMGEDFPEHPELAELMESMFADVHSEVILVDGVVYMQLSGGMFDMSDEFGADAWFTIDLAELGDLDAIYEQFGGLDLASQTETLLNEITNVEETGDGVYTGTLNPDSELMRSMLGTTAAAGDPTGQAVLEAAEVVITVDDEGLLQTIEMTFPEIEGLTMHLVSEVVEVGGEYDIAAPDSDNLRSFEELVGAMQLTR